jgi:ATP-dependent exoDNAse (exonuclease V) beta subunit
MFTFPKPVTYDYIFDRDYGFLFNLGILKEDYRDILKNIIVRLKLSNKRDEESLRLLYVALTRAENYLIFSLDLDKKNRKKSEWAQVIIDNVKKSELDNYIENSKKVLSNIEKLEKRVEKPEKIELKLAKIKAQEKEVSMLSPTMINIYLQCPRKYYYLANFGTKLSKTESLKLGEKVHLLLKEGTLDLEDLDLDIKANRLVNEIFSTDFWQNMISSKNYRELPFIINFGYTIIRGTIDLVYEQNGEWNIIDYKTQSMDIEQYRGQLLCYVLGLYYLKSYRAKKIGLYSIRNRQLVTENAPEIETIENMIRTIVSDIENDKFPRISNEVCKNCEVLDLCKKDEL